ALFLLGQAGNVGGGTNANLSTLDCRLKLRRAVVTDFPCAFDAALSDVKKLGGLRLGGFANWRMLVVAAFERRQSFRDHSPLTLIQVTALEILADDETDRIVADIGN